MSKEGFEAWNTTTPTAILELVLWIVICFWGWVIVGVFIHADLSILNPFTWLPANRAVILLFSVLAGFACWAGSVEEVSLINYIRKIFWRAPKRSLEDELKEFEMWKNKFGEKK